jgi:tRNA(adenine34) deaminase
LSLRQNEVLTQIYQKVAQYLDSEFQNLRYAPLLHNKVFIGTRITLKHPDEKFMRHAMNEARKAAQKGEVPVGAVVVKDGKIVGRGHNLTESKQSALTHAELMALNKASKKVKSWRLNDCDLYVTLEPCTMCAGAIVLSRIRNLYYGTTDPKAGAVESTIRVLDNPKLNHRVKLNGGILKEECSKVLSDFFKEVRRKK